VEGQPVLGADLNCSESRPQFRRSQARTSSAVCAIVKPCASNGRHLPARPIEACDKAKFDGIAAGEKDDRNNRGCSLGRESRAAGDCQDHHHLLPNMAGPN
jgi:hypothetical protein